MKPVIAITLGDPAGIGPEIVARALRMPEVRRACQPVVIGDPSHIRLHHLSLPSAPMLAIHSSGRIRLGTPSRAGGLAAIAALEVAAHLIRQGKAAALATAPVSKESFDAAHFGFPGHTEWLACNAGVRDVEMLMCAGSLRAILMTRHLPLRLVPSRLSARVIEHAAQMGWRFVREQLKRPRPRVVLCGLNPHAGDNGLLGTEEKQIFRPAVKRLAQNGIRIAGPLPADVAFKQMAHGGFDLALAAYHDQGMIPLKVSAPEKMVNLTLGLPYIRTSPGHGTAFDLAGKHTADPRPMVEAIVLAARYAGSTAA